MASWESNDRALGEIAKPRHNSSEHQQEQRKRRRRKDEESVVGDDSKAGKRYLLSWDDSLLASTWKQTALDSFEQCCSFLERSGKRTTSSTRLCQQGAIK